MSVQAILDKKGSSVETTSVHTKARVAASKMIADGIAALVVVSPANDVIGIVSERDVVRALAKHGDHLSSVKVGDIMRRDLITVGPADSIAHAMALMTQYRARHLPVSNEGRLCGIVSIGDLVKDRLDDLETETRVLRDIYIAAR